MTIIISLIATFYTLTALAIIATCAEAKLSSAAPKPQKERGDRFKPSSPLAAPNRVKRAGV